jgi:carbonic anhydrase/acetyltransferase-like protein (isoleucine patch superfamily)
MPLYEYRGTRPRLGRDVYVAPGASVIGDVAVGDESSIWFGCVVRGDVMPIRLGARTNLQDGSIVHVTGGKTTTTIGDDVTVGHLVLLHGCAIGSRVLVGMGSVLLDGVVVEDDAIIGAGSLVTPGTRIPEGCLAMGRPAKVVRALSDADRAWIRESGRVYVEAARTYRSSSVRVIDDHPITRARERP